MHACPPGVTRASEARGRLNLCQSHASATSESPRFAAAKLEMSARNSTCSKQPTALVSHTRNVGSGRDDPNTSPRPLSLIKLTLTAAGEAGRELLATACSFADCPNQMWRVGEPYDPSPLPNFSCPLRDVSPKW